MADAWRQKYTDWVNTQPVENCTITSDRGDLLRGYYLPPKGDSKVIVFGSHGLMRTTRWTLPYLLLSTTTTWATVSFAATMWAPVPPVASMWALITMRAKICSAGSST